MHLASRRRMQGGLQAAMGGEAWALLGLVYSHGAVLDDEGRPLGEGRAPSELRAQVPMVVKRCPYKDERLERWMNISALTQITNHLDVVSADIESFRARLSADAGWEGVSATLMYQMSQPALQLLRARSESFRIPAKVAVAFKLAAGYTNPIRELLIAQARGSSPEFSLLELNRRIRAGKYLVGAREVCAAPDTLLDKVSSTYLCLPDEAERRKRAPTAPPSPRISDGARAIAHLLMLEIHLGICWEIYDEHIERRLLSYPTGDAQVRALNQFVARQLKDRVEHFVKNPEVGQLTLSTSLPSAVRTPLLETLAQCRRIPDLVLVGDALRQLPDQGTCALRVEESLKGAFVTDLFTEYLFGYCAFCRAACELEAEIRKLLELPVDTPYALTSILRQPKAMLWFELMFGYRFRMGDLPKGNLVLRNKEGTEVALPDILWKIPGTVAA